MSELINLIPYFKVVDNRTGIVEFELKASEQRVIQIFNLIKSNFTDEHTIYTNIEAIKNGG